MSILTSLPTLQPPDHNKIDLVYNKKKIKREEKEKEKLMRAEKVALQQKSSAMNKDYMSMAREYVVTTPFRNLDSQEIKCALCKTGIAKTVFFPCTHKCVCDECIEKNKIGKPGLEGSWNMCPICCDEIKIALPSTGDEVERYWKWVREVKPFIPPNFIRAFHKRSTANIKRLVGGDADRDIYDDGGEKSERREVDEMERCRFSLNANRNLRRLRDSNSARLHSPLLTTRCSQVGRRGRRLEPRYALYRKIII